MPQDKNIHIDQIFIELTNVCNFNCNFCPNDKMTRAKTHMDKELAKRLIDEIADRGISNKIAFLLMGEPLLYPDIFHILDYAVSKNILVTFSTNGALLTNENIDKLLNIPLDILQISLQTPSEDSFELRRGNHNITYERYINGIKTLLRNKFNHVASRTKVSILLMDTRFSLAQMLLNGRNTLRINFDVKQLEKLVNELYEAIWGEGKKYFSKNIFSASSKRVAHCLRRFFVSSYKINISDKIEFVCCGLHDWGNIMVNKRIMPSTFGSCNALTGQLAVLSNGNYTLCCKDYNGELVIGDSHKQSLTDILMSDKAKKIRKDFRLCRLPFKRCRICRGATNIFDLALRQIFTSVAYNSPFILRSFNKLLSK